MARMVALIRGINVGKAKRVAMADLREVVAGLGCDNVASYIASGNLVCDAPHPSPGALAEEISDGIANRFGFTASVVALTAAEFEAITDHSPHLDAGADPKRVIVTVFDRMPDAAALAAIPPDGFLPETFTQVDRSIHIHTPNGQAEMQLDNSFWEKALDRTATTRTWGTMQKLRALL